MSGIFLASVNPMAEEKTKTDKSKRRMELKFNKTSILLVISHNKSKTLQSVPYNKVSRGKYDICFNRKGN